MDVNTFAWRNHHAKTIQETYRLATEGGNEGFYILLSEQDKNGFITDFTVVDCNEKGAAFFALSKENFLGEKVSDYYSGEYVERVMHTYRLGMENGFYEDDYRIPEESPIKAEWVQREFVRADHGLAITLRDISESKRHESEMSRLASEDAFTALPNRHWLMNYLPAALVTAQLGVAKDEEIFFTAIVSMSKALNMRIVAEGVETLVQLQILQTLACNEIQGCYIAKPLPASDVPALTAKHHLFP